MRDALILLFLSIGLCVPAGAQSREQILRDSTIKYGEPIEPYLKSINGGKIIKDFDYAPYINRFLEQHKYVKFPAYPISIGIDGDYKGYKKHIKVNSGNRLYFPSGSKLICPSSLKTNAYMCLIPWDVNDVFIDGIHIIGSKVNAGYKTSMYGAGIAMYAPRNILLSNATVEKSSGDGVAVRVHWKRQSQDIRINKLSVKDATRVGLLVTGIINGVFKDVKIEGTGEEDQTKVVKPQTALSFEPNDCTSKYVNCRFYNLKTTNNLGPVLATANFYHIFADNTCGPNKIDIVINNWVDFTDDPNVYGASFAVGSNDLGKTSNKEVSGNFTIINPTIIRNTPKPNYYFFQGTSEAKKGVKYTLTNLKLVQKTKTFNLKNKGTDERIKKMIDQTNLNSKVTIK